MIYEKEVDIYLKAKRQLKIGRAIATLCISMLVIFICLRIFDVNNIYLDMAVVCIFVGSLVNADGGTFSTYVSKSKLLKIIERQINNDPEAIKYIASKKTL